MQRSDIEASTFMSHNHEIRSESLDPRRARRAKVSFNARRVPLDAMQRLIHGRVAPEAGDLVLARVELVGHHEKLQLADGRRSQLFVGDEIVLAYGNRYAPNQFEALVPANLEDCHLAAGGGIASLVLERHSRMEDPTAIRPLGLLADARGRRLTLADFRLQDDTLPTALPPIVAVVGTSMDSGKTTTAGALVRGLTRAGLTVGTAKVTGTGASGDLHHFLDCGAELALDFVDAGLATSYRASADAVERCMRTLVAALVANGSQAIVLEVADGIYQDETAALIRSTLFRTTVGGLIFASGEALSAVAGVRLLEAEGHRVLGASGVMTASALAAREARRMGNFPVYTVEDLERPELALLLTRRTPNNAAAK